MYAILTTKPGQYRTEPGEGMTPREAYDYMLFGRLRARFVIAEMQGPSRVRIIEDQEGGTTNQVPTKFLPRFDKIADARAELDGLIRFGDLDARLVPQEVAIAPAEPPKADVVNVTFVNNDGKRVTTPANSNLLRVSLREQGGIPFKCGGGVCGTCKCRIVEGVEHTDTVKPKERKHLSDAQLAQGWRMACQTFVRGDVSVAW